MNELRKDRIPQQVGAANDLAGTELTQHDQLLALAVATLIADLRGGGEVRVVGCPDAVEREREAVELITVDAIGELALEHTLVEPFEGEMRERPRLHAYEKGLRERLDGRLPAGSQFHLVLHVSALDGIKPTSGRLDLIAAWVEIEAPRLEDGSPRTAPRHCVDVGPPDLPFVARLYRWTRAADPTVPVFSCRLATPGVLAERRAERITRALDRKLPKLLDAAGSLRQSVLVLESVDIQLSNAWDIAAAVHVAASRAAVSPADWIVLVENVTASPTAWVLRGSGQWIDEIEPRLVPPLPML